jgi:hypothetical protein
VPLPHRVTGQLTLQPPAGQPGASSRPPLAADAAVHTGTSPSCGHRCLAAAAAPATADTAAATTLPTPQGITGSSAVLASSTVSTTPPSVTSAALPEDSPKITGRAAPDPTRPPCRPTPKRATPKGQPPKACPQTSATPATRTRYRAITSSARCRRQRNPATPPTPHPRIGIPSAARPLLSSES